MFKLTIKSLSINHYKFNPSNREIVIPLPKFILVPTNHLKEKKEANFLIVL
jgi:hypothetical protein